MKKQILALVVAALLPLQASASYCVVKERLSKQEWAAAKRENLTEAHCKAQAQYGVFMARSDKGDPKVKKALRECRALSILTGRVIYEKYSLVDPCG